MRRLITILARGGSKGLPGKHMMDLCGKPLIQWTIDAAQFFNEYADIVISSDDAELLSFAENQYYNGNLILNRGDNFTDSNAPKIAAIKHATIEAEKHFSHHYDQVIDLDATAPLRTTGDIENCIDLFETGDYNTVFSVTKSRKNPNFNMVEMVNGFPRMVKPGNINRRQDAPYVYDMNASIYVYGREWLAQDKTNRPVTRRSSIYIMEDWQAFDIDTQTDLDVVDAMMKKYMIGGDDETC